MDAWVRVPPSLLPSLCHLQSLGHGPFHVQLPLMQEYGAFGFFLGLQTLTASKAGTCG